MPASAHSNEQYETLLHDVSPGVRRRSVAVNPKKTIKVSGGNILSQLVNEIEREQDQQRFAAFRH
ncbi:hypothetical protein M8494_07350 [Serratia ureilytica]